MLDSVYFFLFKDGRTVLDVAKECDKTDICEELQKYTKHKESTCVQVRLCSHTLETLGTCIMGALNNKRISLCSSANRITSSGSSQFLVCGMHL